jgi:hypothetical protein
VLLHCVQHPCQQLWGHQGRCLRVQSELHQLLQRSLMLFTSTAAACARAGLA